MAESWNRWEYQQLTGASASDLVDQLNALAVEDGEEWELVCIDGLVAFLRRRRR